MRCMEFLFQSYTRAPALAGSFTDRECDQSDDEPYLAAIGQAWQGDVIVDMEGDGTIPGGSQACA